jgi:hypothetical protein
LFDGSQSIHAVGRRHCLDPDGMMIPQ